MKWLNKVTKKFAPEAKKEIDESKKVSKKENKWPPFLSLLPPNRLTSLICFLTIVPIVGALSLADVKSAQIWAVTCLPLIMGLVMLFKKD